MGEEPRTFVLRITTSLLTRDDSSNKKGSSYYVSIDKLKSTCHVFVEIVI